MAALLRFFTILRCLLRYRLDTLLPREHLGWPLRLLCALTSLLPEPTLSRGERLRRFCEDLGPVFIKFGQLLSTRPDLLPADLIAELDQLQDKVPPFDPEQSRQLIEAALEAPVAELFARFDSQPLASASVAQVHAAELLDGREVVVKVVRPGLEHVISKDIALMSLLARLIEKFSEDGRRLRLIEVIADYRHVIFDELDLQREAANASQLRRNFAKSPLLYIPEVYWPYCRRNVMVMERIYGTPVTRLDELNAQHTDMKLLAERGVEIFFTQVFKHNFFHADMHPGNIFVSHQHPERPQYIAVDMAIVGSLTQADQYYLARNLLAMFRRDYRLVAELHIQSGWVPKNTPLNEFEAAIRTVCEPIFEKPLKEISFGQVLIKLFQTARRFDMQVQPQLILLQKTLLNIEGLGRQLYPDLDLWATAHPFLENWVRDRFHPNNLWQQLKRYGPEWMEQFPQVPQALFNALKQADNLSKIAPELHSAAEHFARQRDQAPRRRLLSMAALVAAGAALISAWPALGQQLANLPPLSWGLAGIAAAAWLLR